MKCYCCNGTVKGGLFVVQVGQEQRWMCAECYSKVKLHIAQAIHGYHDMEARGDNYAARK